MPKIVDLHTAAGTSIGIPQLTSSMNILTQDSALLRLPAEIKNHVLELATIQEKAPTGVSVCLKLTRGADGKHFTPTPTTPSILHVCRELRASALPIYYGANTFCLSYSARQPGVIEASCISRGIPHSALRSINVTFDFVYVRRSCVIDHLYYSRDFRIGFIATAVGEGQGVMVGRLYGEI